MIKIGTQVRLTKTVDEFGEPARSPEQSDLAQVGSQGFLWVLEEHERMFIFTDFEGKNVSCECEQKAQDLFMQEITNIDIWLVIMILYHDYGQVPMNKALGFNASVFVRQNEVFKGADRYAMSMTYDKLTKPLKELYEDLAEALRLETI